MTLLTHELQVNVTRTIAILRDAWLYTSGSFEYLKLGFQLVIADPDKNPTMFVKRKNSSDNMPQVSKRKLGKNKSN